MSEIERAKRMVQQAQRIVERDAADNKSKTKKAA